MILFLDDQPIRHGFFAAQRVVVAIVHAIDYASAVEALNTLPPFDEAHLDHDLGDYRPGGYGSPPPPLTGEDVAIFIAKMPADRRPLRVVIHSWNPVGAVRMERILRDAGVDTVRQPFSVPKELLVADTLWSAIPPGGGNVLEQQQDNEKGEKP